MTPVSGNDCVYKMKQIPDIEVSNFRTRRRDELPMEHNRNDIYVLTQQQRARRLKAKEELRQISYESENLRQYSQRRFDYAVHNVSLRESPSRSPRRLLSCSFRPSTSTGPTTYGSVLYNKTPLLLNSVRVRPHSETPSMYDHTPTTYPDIQKTLCQSNWEFQVRPNSYLSDHEESCGSLAEDFVLVPLSNRSRSDGLSDIQDWESVSGASHSRPQTTDHSIPKVKLDVMSSPMSTLFRRHKNIEEFISPSQIPEKTKEAQRTTSCGAAISMNPLREEKQDYLTVSSPKPTAGTGLHGSSPSSLSSGSSVNITLRHKETCWVDELTVSSDNSNERMPEDIETKDDDAMLPDENPGNKNAVGVVFNDEVEENKLLETTPDVEQTCAENVDELQVVNLEDVKDQTIELPKFMCPSSEKKSRQEAIKEWLAKTSFTCAKKTVPLL